MNKIIPLLIRKKRMELHWSQESLCRGICAVSYLSKVENGLIEASAEIEQALLERLGLSTMEDDDKLLEKAGQACEQFYNTTCDFRHPFTTPFTPEEMERLKDSPLLLDILLMEYYTHKTSLPQLKSYESLMESTQRKKFYQLQVINGDLDPDALIEEYHECYSYYLAGQFYLSVGESLLASWYFHQAYSQASHDGSLEMMLLSRVGLHTCYVDNDNGKLAIKELSFIEKLAGSLEHPDEFLAVVYYNTGICFLCEGQDDIALHYLRKVNTNWADLPWLFHHKMAILAQRQNRPEVCRQYLAKARSLIGDKLDLDIVEYRLEHPDYINDPVYEDMLRQVLKNYSNGPTNGYITFNQDFLMEVLESQFRYKEAYTMLKARMMAPKKSSIQSARHMLGLEIPLPVEL